MAGESASMMDKVKAKVTKLREGRHRSAAPGTAGVYMPAVAARNTGTSYDEKPNLMQRLKGMLPGGAKAASSQE